MVVCVEPNLCKSCRLCVHTCPKRVLEISEKVNKKGYNYVQPAREEDCVRCGLCERTCPDFAIHIEKE